MTTESGKSNNPVRKKKYLKIKFVNGINIITQFQNYLFLAIKVTTPQAISPFLQERATSSWDRSTYSTLIGRHNMGTFCTV